MPAALSSTTPILMPVLSGLLLLAGCASAPKPPTVDSAQRRPANAQMAVDLQVCRNDLQNTRILAVESGRLADMASASFWHMSARQQAMAAAPAAGVPRRVGPAEPVGAVGPNERPALANAVLSVRFEFGSTRVVIPPDLAAVLVREARAAPLVLLRGRTDSSTDTAADYRIARDRANAVRDYLLAAGVSPARIRTTHQPSGDHLADNASASGRDLNRRVEIEVYRALPVALVAGGDSTAAAAQ